MRACAYIPIRRCSGLLLYIGLCLAVKITKIKPAIFRTFWLKSKSAQSNVTVPFSGRRFADYNEKQKVLIVVQLVSTN